MPTRDPERVIITGAGGFVGPYLERHCRDAGDVVTGVDLANGPDLLDAAGWVRFVADQTPDVIYHLAGWSDVGGSWSDPGTTLRVNAEGTLHVLDAARRAGTRRVVVISSADVYGVVTPDELPLTERSPVQPSSPYGASKVAAETVAGQYHRGWGVDVVIARPFNHIGPGQSPKFVTSAFADRVARCEADGGGVVRHGDLSPRRDFNDVRDVVRAYRLLAERGVSGATYNVCSGTSIAMSEVLDHLIAAVDVDITTEVDPDLIRPVDLPVLLGDHTRLTADTGWTPTISITESIGDVLDDARQRIRSLHEASLTKGHPA